MVSVVALQLCLPLRALAQAAQQGAGGSTTPIAVEGNRELFATLCALYAAGYGQNLNLATSNPIRQKLAGQMAQLNGPATEAVRQFYHDHQLADPAATLARYISFAMVVGPPPKFAYNVSHDDLPPDVLPIEGFNEVLAAFYTEAEIDLLWRSAQKEYDREVAQISSPFARVVQGTTGYLRELIQPTSQRKFAVYVEPLVGEKTNFRNYGMHYEIVVNGGADPPMDEIRHAFLHYMLEPLVLRDAVLVSDKRPLLQIAGRAPRLPAEYREDFIAFFTECLVRAVELRLRRLPAGGLAAALDQADAEGFILMRPMNRELVVFEQAEPAMSFYFKDFVRAINTAAETKRLQTMAFAPLPEPAPAQAAPQEPKPAEPADLLAWLKEGDAAVKAGDAGKAEAAFRRVLEKYPDQPRADFGLALTFLLKGDADHARELFQKLLALPAGKQSETNPLVQAWSHVYLGHFYDVDRDRDAALKEYRAALAVEGAPQGALDAAQRGLKEPYGPPQKSSKDGKPFG